MPKVKQFTYLWITFFAMSFGFANAATPTFTPTITYTPVPTATVYCPMQEVTAVYTYTSSSQSAVTIAGLNAVGSNTLLLVELYCNSASVSATSVTFGSSPMTLVQRSTANSGELELWKLAQTNGGSGNLTANLSALTDPYLGAVVYQGVDQSNPTGSVSFFSSASSSDAPLTLTTTAQNSTILDFVEGNTNAAFSYSAGLTQRYWIDFWSWSAAAADISTTTVGTYSMEVTVSGASAWEDLSVEIKALGCPPTSTPTSTITPTPTSTNTPSPSPTTCALVVSSPMTLTTGLYSPCGVTINAGETLYISGAVTLSLASGGFNVLGNVSYLGADSSLSVTLAAGDFILNTAGSINGTGAGGAGGPGTYASTGTAGSGPGLGSGGGGYDSGGGGAGHGGAGGAGGGSPGEREDPKWIIQPVLRWWVRAAAAAAGQGPSALQPEAAAALAGDICLSRTRARRTRLTFLGPFK